MNDGLNKQRRQTQSKDRLRQGKINSDTLVWKEGFADWLKLATVAEFSDVASAVAPVEMSGGVAGVGADLLEDPRGRDRRGHRRNRPPRL